MRALDVGCGPGALTAELVERLGPGEREAPRTPRSHSRAACRARQPAVGGGGGERRVAPVCRGRSFDATLSQLVVNFMGDAEAGVREMAAGHSAGRPGGLVRLEHPGETKLLRAFWDAGARSIQSAARPATRSGVDGLVRRGASSASGPRPGACDVRPRPPSTRGATPTSTTWGIHSPRGRRRRAFCQSLDEEGLDALREAYRRHLGAGSGPFELTARAWSAAGTLPGRGPTCSPALHLALELCELLG